MKPKVYFAKVEDGAGADVQAAALGRALSGAGFAALLKKRDMVVVKVHVGERNNTTHMRPEVVAAAVSLIKEVKGEPFVTDTSTLYRGQRENAIRHAAHAHAHGFGIDAVGAPFIHLDGLAGTHEVEVEVNGELSDKVKIAGQLFLADALLVISHATGHLGSGIGAAIKSVGMGLSSRAGKMRQHSTIKPEVMPDKCTECGKCRKWCPEDAIEEGEGASFIVAERCIGCGECIAVCRFGAVKYDYLIESVTLQRSIAEHAAGAIRHFGDKAAYVNLLCDMTKDCDCWNKAQEKIVPDLGVIASTDIVAVDQATLDLTERSFGKNLCEKVYPHLDPTIHIQHAEKMGMGKREYELVEV